MSHPIRAKKNLGQHFLTDLNIAQKIVNALPQDNLTILEIGPGTGVLTQYMIEKDNFNAFDIDIESIDFLKEKYPQHAHKINFQDFLEADLNPFASKGNFKVIGNFPYNISTQIMFKVLEHRADVSALVGMFQKEVAERIASQPGKKIYGILSVFMQAYYDISYLFTVPEHVFQPPPKVKSGVIRCIRNQRKQLDCNETLFVTVVKTGFNQRRKTLRNALKSLIKGANFEHPFLSKRAEELSVENFIELTNCIEKLAA